MNILDLFAGCGGLSTGFKRNKFTTCGFLDWDKSSIDTLKENFKNKDIKDAMFLLEDIRNISNKNSLNIHQFIKAVKKRNLGGIIGGPPCQAYSLAGRIRDIDNMKKDYRNYLFESYIVFLKILKPKFFIFENVLGLLSAKPGNRYIKEIISEAFNQAGYSVPIIDKKIIFNFSDFGVPQNRKRLIIFGVNKSLFKNSEKIVNNFYEFINNYKKTSSTVRNAIGDLEKIFPVKNFSKRVSHLSKSNDPLHFPRYHNQRDIRIFKALAEDAIKKNPVYKNVNQIKNLYNKEVGKSSNVHKYYVLKWSEPSNTIPAHLHKDGLRHIHPDPLQARSITMREAARLQTFSDSFIFKGSRTDIFKMIGNAVSTDFSDILAKAVKNVF